MNKRQARLLALRLSSELITSTLSSGWELDRIDGVESEQDEDLLDAELRYLAKELTNKVKMWE